MTDATGRAAGAAEGGGALPMCPVGETCRRMMERPAAGLLMFVPGGVFVIVGIAIAVEPRFLVWLIATASVLAGIAMLGCAWFMRTTGLPPGRGSRVGGER